MALAYKWSWKEIDECPMNLAIEYADYLTEHPATDFLFAGFVGYKPRKRRFLRRNEEIVIPPSLFPAVSPIVKKWEELPEHVKKDLEALKGERKKIN